MKLGRSSNSESLGHFQSSPVGWGGGGGGGGGEVYLFASLLIFYFICVFVCACWGIFDILLSKFPEM